MNKPLLLSLAAASLLSLNLNAESMYDRFSAMELEMSKLKKEIASLKSETIVKSSADTEEDLDDENSDEESKSDDEESEENEELDINEELTDIGESISELNKATSGSHLKLSVDYRFAVENMQYKMADGSSQGNDAFMTNRFWLNMYWAANENLSFTGQLAYNKAFGARSGANMAPYESFDWIANENAYDDSLRVRAAYFLYRNDTFFDTDIPWTFSVGRRSSTNGYLINLRDDDKAASPMGHAINVEFDGLSSKFNFENVTGINGMYLKVCAGRGMSNAAPKFSAAPYADVETANTNIDLLGFIFVPYSDGQYTVSSQYYFANNLIDVANPMNPMAGFTTVGGMHSFTGNIIINGIGDEINDFLDDSTLFLSGAISKTDPNKTGGGMLGSTESEVGYSAWIGVQTPSIFTEDGRMGFEYNKGSAYWRSITYGEDTNIGSKIAARGDAYEAYFTEYLVDDILSMQVRYTYIDYKHTGSNGFFGNTTGAPTLIEDLSGPMAAQVVDTAQDIRFYLRYKY